MMKEELELMGGHGKQTLYLLGLRGRWNYQWWWRGSETLLRRR